MEGIHSVREKLHSKVLRLRSIEGLVSSILFERLWSDSTMKQRKEAIEYIKTEARKKLITWTQTHESLDIAELPFARLKALARKLCVRNYSRLSKLELIRAIKEVENGSK